MALSYLSTDDGVFVVGPDQRVVYWSDSARRILGYSADQAIGRRCFDVLGSGVTPNLRFCRRNCPVIVNSRRGRQTANYDLCVKTARQDDIWINVSILLLAEPGQRRPQVIHLIRDVTRRRRLEQAARAAMTALREMAGDGKNGRGAEIEEAPAQAPRPLLTRREGEVLRLLSCGLGTREIAASLVISPVTARNHITNLMEKLGARSRLQALAFASRLRLI